MTDLRKQVDSIEFSLFGNDEIKNISALGKDSAGIDIPELFDNNSEPKKNGLIDARMGTTDDNVVCATCELNSTYCCGHFGHIILEDYMFHIGYLQHIKKILSCVCLKCSKLLVYKNEKELNDIIKNKTGKNRLAEIKNLVKDVTHCQRPNVGCGAPVFKIKLEHKKTDLIVRLIAELKTDESKDENASGHGSESFINLTPEMCYNILKNISDEDCIILGLNPKKCRPEDMIHKIFPVPPVPVRPSVKMDGAASAREDDLTRKLADIVKKNVQLGTYKESIGTQSMQNVTNQAQLLQYHIATYFDNETPFMPKTEQKGKVDKSLSSRLKGKEGRFRNNLMGKRVDYSARTVITPDPGISINQVGVPLVVAMNLTYPEVVTKHNINAMQKLVKNGRYIYPGANYVTQKNSYENDRNARIDLRFRKGKMELQIGDIVERHLNDTDIVLLNRQPTLHKQSMMGHYVHVIRDPSYSSFRVNVGVTAPYNADYDGDEMNITAPQDIQTKTELEELTDVKWNIISAGTSNPIMGLKQDGILGAYNMTMKTTRIDWRSVMNMLVNLVLPKNEIIQKEKIYSGHEIFSHILPERINKSNFGQENEILVKSGQLISGYLKKVSLGEGKPNNLIQLILDEYGVNEAKDFFDNAQKLVNKFNMVHGFSVGLVDTVMPEKIIRQNSEIANKEILKANVYVTEIENNPTMVDQVLFEDTISGNLRNVMNDVSSLIMKNMTNKNSIYVMATAGSKGSDNNTGQMIGLLGQQILEGKRVPKKIGKRGLPYFYRNDDTAYGRGFIGNSFLSGLNYPEFVYHNMTSREGLIDTAIKTADTGYTQRKLIKSMEDLQICYDGTLRTATGSIVQFIYGDSGTDTTKQYSYTSDMLMMNDMDLAKRYKFTSDEIKSFNDYSSKEDEEYFNELTRFRDMIRQSQLKTKIDSKTFKSYTNFMLPVNMLRIMDKVRNMAGIETKDKNKGKNKDEILTPRYIIDKLNEVLEHKNTHLVSVPSKINDNKSIKLFDEYTAKTALRLALMNALSPKRCIIEYKLTKSMFDFAIDEIMKGYKRNIVEPGEMVGIIAVQALMPPLTQLTLNTFHTSGTGTKGMTTLGVPRLKELLSLTRALKTPRMMIYLNKENRNNKNMANRIAAYVTQTNLVHVRSKIEVFYDPNPTEEGSFAENDHVGKAFYVREGQSTGQQSQTNVNSCQQNINDLPWLVRIEFDREKLLLKDVTLLDIQSRFCNMWESRFQDLKKASREERQVLDKITRCGIVSNDDNDDVPVIHIRFDMIDFTIETITNFVDIIVDNLKMKGIESIVDVNDPSEESCVDMDNQDHEIKNTKEYVIYTSGINMFDIRYINGVDISRTICNDVMKVYDIFGIEAARIALLREITTMLERAATFVNYHHLSVLVDLMTRDGFMISIDRHGMGRTDAAPLGKVSFEKPVDQLLLAAVFNESDPLHGVSARIMTGNIIKGGTGMCDVMLDSEMIEKSEYIEEEGVTKDIVDDSGTTLIDDVIGKKHEDVFVPI